MSDLRKAAEMALDALDAMNPYPASKEDQRNNAIQALRQALAQPPCQTGSQCIGGKCPECERKWVGLDKSDMNVLRSVAEFASDVEGFIRLVEDKLRSKNT